MLNQLSKYTIAKDLSLILLKGSVAHFVGKTDKSAIVNAANAGVLGGGGVDGAISSAGGPRLYEDRLRLPVVEKRGQYEIRCRIGSAVLTGPGDYDELGVPYVIHAVGPNYNMFDEEEYDEAHARLKSAYTTTLNVASENRIEQVAFSLLSAGIFRGMCSLEEVLSLGMEAVINWGLSKPEDSSVSEIYIVAFTPRECKTLKKICDKIFGIEDAEEPNSAEEDGMDVDAKVAGIDVEDTDGKPEDEAKPEEAPAGVDNDKSETIDENMMDVDEKIPNKAEEDTETKAEDRAKPEEARVDNAKCPSPVGRNKPVPLEKGKVDAETPVGNPDEKDELVKPSGTGEKSPDGHDTKLKKEPEGDKLDTATAEKSTAIEVASNVDEEVSNDEVRKAVDPPGEKKQQE